MHRYAMHIDGRSHEPASGEWFPTEDPFRARPWAEIARGSAADVDRAVEVAHRALAGPWTQMSASDRGTALCRLADLVERDADHLARVEVRDNGKLLSEMSAQTAYLPSWYRYYGGLADKLEGSVVPIDKAGYFTYTRREPVGVVGIITPWNSPLLLLGWKLAPALAAGCTVVIKPSEFTSASTIEFARLCEEAGIPPGVVNVVTGFGAEVGASLVRHPLIRKISFTGSDATGRTINEMAAQDFKHVSLELGGKSPNIVFDDADLDAAVNGVVSGIFAASGQTCIAGSRLVVHEAVHDEVVERVGAMAAAARLGDPMDATTQIGPITTRAQHQKILGHIRSAQDEGALLVTGGSVPRAENCGDGWFVEPTVFTGVTRDMSIAQDEVFGPVLAVIPFSDEDEAVAIANDSRYGLGAGVWTSDIARAFRLAERVTSGTVWVNTYRAVSYLAPFGGFKASGLGRENGIRAIEAYVETKTVWVNTGAAVGNPFILR